MSVQAEPMELGLDEFLVPAPGIQCDYPEVQKLGRSIAKGSRNDVEAARRLFAYVRYSVRVPLAEFSETTYRRYGLGSFLAWDTQGRPALGVGDGDEE